MIPSIIWGTIIVLNVFNECSCSVWLNYQSLRSSSGSTTSFEDSVDEPIPSEPLIANPMADRGSLQLFFPVFQKIHALSADAYRLLHASNFLTFEPALDQIQKALIILNDLNSTLLPGDVQFSFIFNLNEAQNFSSLVDVAILACKTTIERLEQVRESVSVAKIFPPAPALRLPINKKYLTVQELEATAKFKVLNEMMQKTMVGNFSGEYKIDDLLEKTASASFDIVEAIEKRIIFIIESKLEEKALNHPEMVDPSELFDWSRQGLRYAMLFQNQNNTALMCYLILESLMKFRKSIIFAVSEAKCDSDNSSDVILDDEARGVELPNVLDRTVILDSSITDEFQKSPSDKSTQYHAQNLTNNSMTNLDDGTEDYSSVAFEVITKTLKTLADVISTMKNIKVDSISFAIIEFIERLSVRSKDLLVLRCADYAYESAMRSLMVNNPVSYPDRAEAVPNNKYTSNDCFVHAIIALLIVSQMSCDLFLKDTTKSKFICILTEIDKGRIPSQVEISQVALDTFEHALNFIYGQKNFSLDASTEKSTENLDLNQLFLEIQESLEPISPISKSGSQNDSPSLNSMQNGDGLKSFSIGSLEKDEETDTCTKDPDTLSLFDDKNQPLTKSSAHANIDTGKQKKKTYRGRGGKRSKKKPDGTSPEEIRQTENQLDEPKIVDNYFIEIFQILENIDLDKNVVKVVSVLIKDSHALSVNGGVKSIESWMIRAISCVILCINNTDLVHNLSHEKFFTCAAFLVQNILEQVTAAALDMLDLEERRQYDTLFKMIESYSIPPDGAAVNSVCSNIEDLTNSKMNSLNSNFKVRLAFSMQLAYVSALNLFQSTEEGMILDRVLKNSDAKKKEKYMQGCYLDSIWTASLSIGILQRHRLGARCDISFRAGDKCYTRICEEVKSSGPINSEILIFGRRHGTGFLIRTIKYILSSLEESSSMSSSGDSVRVSGSVTVCSIDGGSEIC